MPIQHNSIKLELQVDKENNVYRYIYDWQVVSSSHGNNVNYLFLHALAQWGENRECHTNIFTIVMQYSPQIGENVDISQPAHISENDIKKVHKEWQNFIAKCVNNG